MQQEEKKTLDKLLAAGVIRESNSDYSSRPVLVRKKDGSLRYTIDFRDLNKRNHLNGEEGAHGKGKGVTREARRRSGIAEASLSEQEAALEPVLREE